MKYALRVAIGVLALTWVMCNPMIHAQTFLGDVQQASLVNGSSGFKSVKARSDGIFLIAGNLGLSDEQIAKDYAGLPHYKIEGGGAGVILHYSPATCQVLAVTTLMGGITDMEIGDDDAVYLAIGGGTYKLNPECTELIWSGPGDQRLSVASDGTVFAYSGAMKVRKINPDGKLEKEWGMPKTNTGSHRKRGHDVVVCRKNRLVIVSGNNSGNSKTSKNPVFVPWVMAFDFNGKHKWTMFNYTHTEVDPWGMADSRANEMVTRNGKLYILGDSEGGNSGFRRDAQNYKKELDKKVWATNKAHGLSYLASSARKITTIIVADSKNGKTQKVGTYFGLRMKDNGDGRGEAARTVAHDIAVDEKGRIYITGEVGGRIHSAGRSLHMDWPGETGRWKAGYGRVSGPKEIFLAVFSPDMSILEYSSGFAQGTRDTYANIGYGVAAYQGTAVVAGLARQVDSVSALETLYLKHSIADEYRGTEAGYYAALSAKEEESCKAAMIFQEMSKFYLRQGPAEMRDELSKTTSLKKLDEFLAATTKSEHQSKLTTIRKIFMTNMTRRLEHLEHSDPRDALGKYKDMALFCKGTPEEATFKARLEALNKDEKFQDHLATFGAYMTIKKAMQSMDNTGTNSPTNADATFVKKNRKLISLVERELRALQRKHKDNPYTAKAEAMLKARLIPISSKEKALLKKVQAIANYMHMYRTKKMKKDDKKQLAKKIKASVAGLKKSNPDSPFTAEAVRISAKLK